MLGFIIDDSYLVAELGGPPLSYSLSILSDSHQEGWLKLEHCVYSGALLVLDWCLLRPLPVRRAFPLQPSLACRFTGGL